jgi:hypothetical protein
MRRITLIACLMLVAACAGDDADTTTTVSADTTTSAPTTTTAAPTTTTTSTTTTTTQPPTTTRAEPPITIGNFEVELVVIENVCYNTAGANITVRPQLVVNRMPPAGYEAILVYEIHGGEAVQTFNIEITGSENSTSEQRISTESCDDELSVELVNLLEG